jgi:hypothetical protein
MAHLQVWPHWEVLNLSANRRSKYEGVGLRFLLIGAQGLAGRWTHAGRRWQ